MSDDAGMDGGTGNARRERLQRDLANGQGNFFRQMEALLAIHSVISFRSVLPATRGWSISPDFGVLLLQQIDEVRPETIVDLGGGVSSLLAAYRLEQHGAGRVIAVDHNARFAEQSARTFRRHGLESVATARHAPLVDVRLGDRVWRWYDPGVFADLERIDLLVVDGPTQAGNPQEMVRFPALPALRPKLAPGAVILVDDANRSHERRIVDRWLNEFPVTLVDRPACEKGAVILESARIN